MVSLPRPEGRAWSPRVVRLKRSLTFLDHPCLPAVCGAPDGSINWRSTASELTSRLPARHRIRQDSLKTTPRGFLAPRVPASIENKARLITQLSFAVRVIHRRVLSPARPEGPRLPPTPVLFLDGVTPPPVIVIEGNEVFA